MGSLQNKMKNFQVRAGFWPSAAALVLGLTFVVQAPAQTNLEFLKDGPMRKFTAEDLRLLNEALSQALQAPQAGVSFPWVNPNSPAQGKVSLEKIYEKQSRPCRVLKIENRYKNSHSKGKYALCEIDGQWRIGS